MCHTRAAAAALILSLGVFSSCSPCDAVINSCPALTIAVDPAVIPEGGRVDLALDGGPVLHCLGGGIQCSDDGLVFDFWSFPKTLEVFVLDVDGSVVEQRTIAPDYSNGPPEDSCGDYCGYTTHVEVLPED